MRSSAGRGALPPAFTGACAAAGLLKLPVAEGGGGGSRVRIPVILQEYIEIFVADAVELVADEFDIAACGEQYAIEYPREPAKERPDDDTADTKAELHAVDGGFRAPGRRALHLLNAGSTQDDPADDKQYRSQNAENLDDFAGR